MQQHLCWTGGLSCLAKQPGSQLQQSSAYGVSNCLQVTLDEQREVYRPLAARGSALFFLIQDLQGLNHMYRFSLSVFLGLVKQVTAQAQDML